MGIMPVTEQYCIKPMGKQENMQYQVKILESGFTLSNSGVTLTRVQIR